MTLVDAAPTTEARFVELCRQATAILVAALVSGMIFGGVGSRVFMLMARLLAPDRRGAITEAGNVVGEVTLAGSFFLIVFAGLLTAVAVGVMMGITQPWLERAGRWEGPLVGWLVLAVFSRAVIEPDNFDFFLLGDQVVTVAMIGALGVAAGWSGVALRDRLMARLPVRHRILGDGKAYLPGAILGAVGLLLVVGLGGATETPGDTTALDLIVGIGIGVLAIATIVDRVRWMVGRGRGALLRAVAIAGLVGAIIAGTLRLVHDVTLIIP